MDSKKNDEIMETCAARRGHHVETAMWIDRATQSRCVLMLTKVAMQVSTFFTSLFSGQSFSPLFGGKMKVLGNCTCTV